MGAASAAAVGFLEAQEAAQQAGCWQDIIMSTRFGDHPPEARTRFSTNRETSLLVKKNILGINHLLCVMIFVIIGGKLNPIIVICKKEIHIVLETEVGTRYGHGNNCATDESVSDKMVVMVVRIVMVTKLLRNVR